MLGVKEIRVTVNCYNQNGFSLGYTSRCFINNIHSIDLSWFFVRRDHRDPLDNSLLLLRTVHTTTHPTTDVLELLEWLTDITLPNSNKTRVSSRVDFRKYNGDCLFVFFHEEKYETTMYGPTKMA